MARRRAINGDDERQYDLDGDGYISPSEQQLIDYDGSIRNSRDEVDRAAAAGHGDLQRRYDDPAAVRDRERRRQLQEEYARDPVGFVSKHGRSPDAVDQSGAYVPGATTGAFLDAAEDTMPSPEELTTQFSYEDDVAPGGYSRVGMVQSDPSDHRRDLASMDSQIDALHQIATGDGFNSADRKRFARSEQRIGQEDMAGLGAESRYLDVTGQSNPQLEGYMRDQFGQAAGQSANERALQMIATGEQNKRDARDAEAAALGQLGQMRSQERDQSFAEQATRANAVDDFQNWNVERQRQIAARNAARRNAEAENKANVTRVDWQNRKNVANARGARLAGQLDDVQKQRQRDTNTGLGMIRGVASAFPVVGGVLSAGVGIAQNSANDDLNKKRNPYYTES